jgi:hypothetical protein
MRGEEETVNQNVNDEPVVGQQMMLCMLARPSHFVSPWSIQAETNNQSRGQASWQTGEEQRYQMNFSFHASQPTYTNTHPAATHSPPGLNAIERKVNLVNVCFRKYDNPLRSRRTVKNWQDVITTKSQHQQWRFFFSVHILVPSFLPSPLALRSFFCPR